jgi:hypothetical protein
LGSEKPLVAETVEKRHIGLLISLSAWSNLILFRYS